MPRKSTCMDATVVRGFMPDGTVMILPTHSRGLALRNALGAFRHKQDSTLVAEQTAIFSVCSFLRVNIQCSVTRTGGAIRNKHPFGHEADFHSSPAPAIQTRGKKCGLE